MWPFYRSQVTVTHHGWRVQPFRDWQQFWLLMLRYTHWSSWKLPRSHLDYIEMLSGAQMCYQDLVTYQMLRNQCTGFEIWNMNQYWTVKLEWVVPLGPSSSSCKGLQPLSEAYFPHLGKTISFYNVLLLSLCVCVSMVSAAAPDIGIEALIHGTS